MTNKVEEATTAMSRILIVEDEGLVATFLKRLLTKLGYDVVGVVASGEDALQRVDEQRPDLALMDIELAGKLNGIETAAQLRARHDVPVVYLTAYAEDALLLQAKVTEPYGYLIKPVQERELCATIEMALYKHEMERKLRESEEWFRAMVQNSTDIFAVTNADGKIRYHSPAIERVLGYLPDERMGLDILELIHPDDWPQAQAMVADLLRDPSVTSRMEARFRHRDGSWRVFEAVGSNLLDNPAIAGVIVNTRDITERVRTEARVKRLNAVLRAIRNVNQLIVREKDRDRLLQSVCDILIETRGYHRAWIALVDESKKLVTTAEAGLGRDFSLVVERMERGEWMYCARKALAQPGVLSIDEPSSTCAGCPLSDGCDDTRRLAVRLEHGDQVYGLLAVYIPIDLVTDKEEHSLLKDVAGDIAFALYNVQLENERRQAEKRLHDSEAELRSIFRAAPIGIGLVSNRVLVQVNDLICEMLGYSGDELVGKSARVLYPTDEDYEYVGREKYAQIRERGTGTVETRWKRKDGEIIDVLLSSAALDPADLSKGVTFTALDITERVRAEEALRESEARWRSLTETSPDHILTLDADLNIQFANFASPGLTVEELIGTPLYIYVGEERQAEVKALLESVLKTGDLTSYETTYDAPSGGLIHYESRVVPRRLPGSDEIIGLTLSSRDVTERVQTENEIRRRTRELAMLNRVIASCVSGQDMASILETACRELALTFDLPQSAAALLNEEKTQAVVVAEYCAPGRPSGLNEIIPVEGNPSYQYLFDHQAPLVVDDAQHDLRLAPIHDLMRRRGTVSLLLLPLLVEDEVVGSLGLDATDPRHFSEAEVNLAWRVVGQAASALARMRLLETQRRLTAAIEQAAEIVVITDSEGDIVYVNPAFERITGYTEAEALGQNPRILKSGRQDAAFYEELWATISGGEVWHGRFVNKKKDGTLYTEEATISPVWGAEGEIDYYVAVKRDVTREMALEAQFYQAQKMEAVGRLAGGVAHDFNNILTAIQGYTSFALDDLDPNDPMHADLMEIEKAADRAAALTGQLLAFSRKQIVQPRVLNLNEVVVGMEGMLRRLIGEDIDLITVLDPELGQARVDPGQIEQVLMNLSVNARDAMPAGGKMTVETANVGLDAEYANQHPSVVPGSHVMLAVSDDGIGMDEEVKSHLFEPFFTTKERGQGTGLGLATVYGIVKQSGGSIWAYSEPGVGTTFKVYLPRVRVQEEDESITKEPLLDALLRGTETILLVEDEDMVRELAHRTLRRYGYTVLEARHPGEALLLSEKYGETIHLLLTDVVMPSIGGRALAERLTPSRPEMKVLYISGYMDNAIVHHGVLEPGLSFLQKPFTPDALARKVREALEGGHC